MAGGDMAAKEGKHEGLAWRQVDGDGAGRVWRRVGGERAGKATDQWRC